MKEDFYKRLIQKQLSANISPAEAERLEHWLQAKSEHRSIYDAARTEWEASGNINVDTSNTPVRQIPQRNASQRTWQIVVAGLLVLIAGTLWLRNNSSTIENKKVMITNLSEGVKTVPMPDGTKAMLNENSSISYPEKFSGDRKVTLNGEAYFKVEHKPNHPFILRISKGHEVKVLLGTEFTVQEHQVELKVNVAKGKVQLSSDLLQSVEILTAGMEAKINQSTGELVIDKDATENADYWRTQTLRYDEIELGKVVKELQEIFMTPIALPPKNIASCKISATFSNFELNKILLEIATDLGADVYQNDSSKPIRFSGGTCP